MTTFLSVLTVLFIALKLTGDIDWSWLLVLLPLLVPLILAAVLLAILGLINLFTKDSK